MNDRDNATRDAPLLNSGEYIPEAGRTVEDDETTVLDISTSVKDRTLISDARFYEIYNDTMRFFRESEDLTYKQYQLGTRDKDNFFKECATFLQRHYPAEMLNENDFNAMLKRINLTMFGYDILQPLIDNPLTSDIKVCSPQDIRVRIKGKAYQSNACFLDENDLRMFIKGLGYRNNLDIMKNPQGATFTDNHDQNYILRFSISNPKVCAVDYPYIHIRKISKTKPDMAKLIEDKMINENIRKYLIDRAKLSRGIVFAGPPGSGKTTLLNAFIEYIPRTRETLVIQENDELFTEQSGFMFKHPTHPINGDKPVTLEELGQMALVEGCNEFIIGEVKGAEMRYAMTLLNAGGYVGLTIHSTNAYETLDKMADLVKYGSSYSFEEARYMLKTFDTVVYMEDYSVKEILEVKGYNMNTHSYEYVPIYIKN